jgi:polysaccharide biosynthesis/export protein
MGNKQRRMTQNRSHMWDNRQLPDTDTAYRRQTLGTPACLFAFLVFAALACGGCQTSTPLPNPPNAYTPVSLVPGDVIKLSFTDEIDLNQTQKIRRDGKVSLPLLGEVTAAGKRLIDFQNELIRRYEPQLENSDVLVTLENGTATVTVSGFANKPGRFLFDRPTTVFQAIMEAGGVSDYGSLSNVHLVRIINGEQRTEILNLKPTIRGKSTEAKYVKDGDVIYVSRSLF